MNFSDSHLSAISSALLSWYRASRRDLPWRRTRDSYAIWVSEVMLQQTRVDTVIPYYERFMNAYPTVMKLAEATESEVLTLWSGLGYYRRARFLHRGAQAIKASGKQKLPLLAHELEEVPGIGRYTAGAIASIAHGQVTPLVDGNVVRVLSRIFAIKTDVSSVKGRERVWELAQKLVGSEMASNDPGAFNQSLMELGALVCVPREPRCDLCPVRALCDAKTLGLERTLPRLAAKSRPLEWRRVAIVARSKKNSRGASRVLLARRAGDQLMGGLWEPPMIDADKSAIIDAKKLARDIGIRVTSISELASVTHVLSHRRMSIAVVGADLSSLDFKDSRTALDLPAYGYDALDLISWPPAKALARTPMSTLAKKLLLAAANNAAPIC